MSPPRVLSIAAGLVAGVILITGCSTQTQSTAPAASRTAASVSTDATLDDPTSLAAIGELVDLRPGRVTQLDRVFRIWDVLPDGSLGPVLEIPTEVESRITGTEVHDGRTYKVEETIITEFGQEYPNTLLLRQDRSGLYFFQPEEARDAQPSIALGENDAPSLPPDLAAAWAMTADRPQAWRAALARTLTKVALVRAIAAGSLAGTTTLAGPPGGPLSDEVTLLRYPLRPGATWDGLVGFNVWTVEAVGTTVLPVGRMWTARLDIDLPGIFDGNDKVTYWYGAPGEVKHLQFIRDVATDENGEPIGEFVTEDEALITSYEPGTDDPL